MACWRHMTEADIDGVDEVAQIVHAQLPERPEVFRRRLEIFAQGCRILVSQAGTIGGYAIAQPIRPFDPPQLDQLPGAIMPDFTQFYIHDVAILPEFRGGNHARAIIADLLQLADAYESAALVSVYGTHSFWERFGFRIADQDLGDKLSAYGTDAVFMIRSSSDCSKL